MFKNFYAKVVIWFCLLIPYVAIGNTLTFEDFKHKSSGTPYNGFIFGNRWWQVSDIGNPLSFDNCSCASSIIKRADNSLFVFEGASFWSRANDKNITTTIQMYNLSGLVSSMEFRLDKVNQPFIESVYTDPISYMTVSVDAKTIKDFNRNYLAMDNFTYTTPVDEPHPFALITAGIVLIGFMSHRKGLQESPRMV